MNSNSNMNSKSKHMCIISPEIFKHNYYINGGSRCREDIDYWVSTKTVFDCTKMQMNYYNDYRVPSPFHLGRHWLIPSSCFIPALTEDEEFLNKLQ